jgi:GNAT superfamily N-acetyltransferase
VTLRPAIAQDICGMVALQRACFPAPFPEELLWNDSHLARHVELFPAGQFVILEGDAVVASASNTLIGEAHYQEHLSWDDTVGGYLLNTFDPKGTTLYGLDISVHPDYRRQGLARNLYKARFDLVQSMGLRRYATGCRLPDFHAFEGPVDEYLGAVNAGNLTDRTLTPLLKLGLRLIGGHENYMEDEESRNCAALLEWTP